MFSIKKSLSYEQNTEVHLTNNQKNLEYSMFITINANEEKLNDKIFYYYPNESIKVEKFQIHPEKPHFYLDFYRKNLSNYEKICNSVKLLFSMNSNISKYNTSTGNFVKIIDGTKEKKCILSCYSLIKKLDLEMDDDMNKIEIYMVSNSQNLYQFFKKLDFLINLNSPKDKINFFEAIKKEYGLIQLETHIQSLKKRSEFIKCFESTDSDYIFRDPMSDKIVLPGLDILLLNIDSNNYALDKDLFSSDENFIEINLQTIENVTNLKLNRKDNFLTFITYQIPQQKIDNILGRSKKLKNDDIINTTVSNHIGEGFNAINYEEFRCLEFSKSCCNFYDRSINFGKYENNPESGLRVGYYSFNTNSAGTLLLNSDFKPVGIAFFGSLDYNPFKKSKKLYNLFIPLDNIGVLYIFKNFLCNKDENIKLQDFIKEKNIILVKGSLKTNKNINRELHKFNDDVLEESEKIDMKDEEKISENENADLHFNQETNLIDIDQNKNSGEEKKSIDQSNRPDKKEKRRKKKVAPKQLANKQVRNKFAITSDYILTRRKQTSVNKNKLFEYSSVYIDKKQFSRTGNKTK